MKLLKNPLVVALASVFMASTAAAATNPQTFYVSPDGADTNDGSSDTPFKTVVHAVNQASGGDTIYLKGGDYGTVILKDKNFGSYVNIRAVQGEVPRLDYLYTEDSSHLAFSGLSVTAERAPALDSDEKLTFCKIWQGPAVVCFIDSAADQPEPKSANIKFENGVIKSFDTSLLTATSDHDASLINAADPEFWADTPRLGVYISSEDTSIKGNLIANVNGGITIKSADEVDVEDNQIINTSATGVRISGSNSVDIDGNIFKNFYGAKTSQSDSYKPKAINNYSPETEVTGVRITNNFISPSDDASVGSENMGMGGAIISYSDGGILSDWTVSKNVIFNGGWHSITLDNAKTIEISNNLEIDVNPDDTQGSFGVSLGFGGDWGNNDYSEVDQVVTCNVMSGLSGSYINAKALALDPAFDDHNVIGAADENWATDVNSYWDDECEVELSYRLIDKAM